MDEQSLAIALFSFGGLLVLIAMIGGNFKALSSEIPHVGIVPRVAAAVLCPLFFLGSIVVWAASVASKESNMQPAAAASTPAPPPTNPERAQATNAASMWTKADFLIRANELCRALNEAAAPIAASAPDIFVDPQGAADGLDQVALIGADMLQRLGTLPVPLGDESIIGAMLAKGNAWISTYRGAGSALRVGDRARLEVLYPRLKEQELAFENAAREYGVVDCRDV